MVEVLLWGFGGEPLYNPGASFEDITQGKRKKPSKTTEESNKTYESLTLDALGFGT